MDDIEDFVKRQKAEGEKARQTQEQLKEQTRQQQQKHEEERLTIQMTLDFEFKEKILKQ